MHRCLQPASRHFDRTAHVPLSQMQLVHPFSNDPDLLGRILTDDIAAALRVPSEQVRDCISASPQILLAGSVVNDSTRAISCSMGAETRPV